MALLVAAAALSLSVTWLVATVLFWAWGRLLVREPQLARWTPVVAALPLVLGGLFVVASLLPGDPHSALVAVCHCATSMPGWLHLCPVHPNSAAALLPVSVGLLVLLVPGRLYQLLPLLREPLGDGGAPVVVSLPQPTALVVGWLRPTVVIDSGLWAQLGGAEREAVLAHERGHLARRDPTVLMALRVMVSVGAAPAGRAVLRGWLRHAELQADAAAADAVGDPVRVAEALLRCARAGRAASVPALSWDGGRIEQRIHALLRGGPVSAPARPDVRASDVLLLAGLVLAGLATQPWLHHQIEHLLNLPL